MLCCMVMCVSLRQLLWFPFRNGLIRGGVMRVGGLSSLLALAGLLGFLVVCGVIGVIT
jgi:hypothetical protein